MTNIVTDVEQVLDEKRLQRYAVAFLRAFVLAFGSGLIGSGLLASGGPAWSWSALLGVAAGALGTALEAVWPSIPWRSLIGRLTALQAAETPARAAPRRRRRTAPKVAPARPVPKPGTPSAADDEPDAGAT